MFQEIQDNPEIQVLDWKFSWPVVIAVFKANPQTMIIVAQISQTVLWSVTDNRTTVNFLITCLSSRPPNAMLYSHVFAQQSVDEALI